MDKIGDKMEDAWTQKIVDGRILLGIYDNMSVSMIEAVIKIE